MRASSRSAKKGIWQRRFWEHEIRDETDLHRHVDYVHFNPVKHGLVTRVKDWPYSSFHRYLEREWLTADWGGALGEVEQAGERGEASFSTRAGGRRVGKR